VFFSQRALQMQASPIRRLIPYAEQAKEKGIEVFHLNIGQPDIPTPRVFFEALEKYPSKVVPYSHSAGTRELREAFSDYYRRWDVDLDIEEIIITNGGSEAIIFALSVVADPGDEVLVVEPFYANYKGFAGMANVHLVPVAADPEKGYELPSTEEFEAHITPKTRAIIFSNPCNPTGAVYPKKDLLRLLDFAQKHDLIVIADEVYREFTFDGLEPYSILSFKNFQDRIVLVDSVSKRYSCCGARVGLIASKIKPLMTEVMKMAQARLCPPTMEQVGALAMVNLPPEYITQVRDEYQLRRDIVYGELSRVPGLSFKKPQGAFYLAVKLPVDNSESFVKWMLTDFHLNGKTTMVAPLDGFYATPEGGLQEIRIAYVLKHEHLKEACEVLRLGLERYMSLTGTIPAV